MFCFNTDLSHQYWSLDKLVRPRLKWYFWFLPPANEVVCHSVHRGWQTPPGRHPLGSTPRADIPPADTPPPPTRRQMKRAVRILLECILVCIVRLYDTSLHTYRQCRPGWSSLGSRVPWPAVWGCASPSAAPPSWWTRPRPCQIGRRPRVTLQENNKGSEWHEEGKHLFWTTPQIFPSNWLKPASDLRGGKGKYFPCPSCGCAPWRN